jgi:zinc protease
LPRIRQLYGALPTVAGTPEKASAEPDQNAMNYANDRADYLQSIVSIGYRVPELKSQESVAVGVLAALLGGGYGHLLSRSTLFSKGLITGASADYLGLSDAGILTVQLRMDGGKIDDAEAAYFGEMEKMRRDAIPAGELQRAQLVLEKKFTDQMSTVEGQAYTLARYQAQAGDFKHAINYVTQLRGVTSEQVQQIASKYLSAANASVFEYESKDAAPRTFPNAEAYAETVGYWIQGARKTTVNQNQNKVVVDLQPMQQGEDRENGSGGIVYELMAQPVRSFDTLHGPHVYVREDHSQPTVTIGFYFQGGRVAESASDNGLTGLMLRSMVRGSKEHPNVAIQLEQVGGTLQIVNEADYYGFSLEVLSRNAEPALKLLIDLIEHPAFDKVAVAREKTLALADLRQYADDNRQRPIDLFWHSLYPSHPYGRNPYGDETTIKNATEDSLKALYNRTIQKQFPLAVLVGDTDGSSLVGRNLTDGFQRREVDQILKLTVPNPAPPYQEAVESRSRKQTVQVTGFASPKGDNADNAALLMIENLLNTSAGRLVDEIEHRQGQAGVVRVLNRPRFLAGGFAVYAASSPENETAVRGLILGQLQRLATEEISDQEFALAKTATIAHYNVAIEDHPFRAEEYARAFFNKQKPELIDTIGERIKLVDKSDIKHAAEQYFKANQPAAGVIRGS